jgi:hypothetical protein
MKLVISEKQLKGIITHLNYNQDLSEEGEGEGAPESGTSSDGEKKTGATLWTSGATRGAYQLGVTKWADSYKITRGRANPLWEQSDSRMPFQPETFGYKQTDAKTIKGSAEKQEKFFKSIDPHTLATVLAIGAAFIPIIGPVLSGAIELADAALYYKEGDNKMAGMAAMFAMIPGIGPVVSTIPAISKLGVKGMKLLANKLGKGLKITDPLEVEVVNAIGKNRQLIQQELNKAGKEISIKAARQKAQKKIVTKNVVKNVVKNVGGYSGAYIGYDQTYDYFARKKEQENIKKLNDLVYGPIK